MKGSKVAVLAALGVVLGLGASLKAQVPTQPAPVQPAQPVAVQPAAVQPAQAANTNFDLDRLIDAMQGLEGMGKLAFKSADINNDNRISQQEAIDAANRVVGGIFFHADQNGDGSITDAEARQAINSLMQQQPLLRFVVDRVRATPDQRQQPDAVQTLISLIDTDNDNQIKASEVRAFVQTMVQSFYATADTNRDGQLTVAELNASVQTTARTVAQAVFNAADTDHNGAISQDEFRRSLEEPANAAFRVVDANRDGQISQQEADSAFRIVVQQLRNLSVPNPSDTHPH